MHSVVLGVEMLKTEHSVRTAVEPKWINKQKNKLMGHKTKILTLKIIMLHKLKGTAESDNNSLYCYYKDNDIGEDATGAECTSSAGIFCW